MGVGTTGVGRDDGSREAAVAGFIVSGLDRAFAAGMGAGTNLGAGVGGAAFTEMTRRALTRCCSATVVGWEAFLFAKDADLRFLFVFESWPLLCAIVPRAFDAPEGNVTVTRHMPIQ